MHPIEIKALCYIRNHIALASFYWRIGNRGLCDWHNTQADTATDKLIQYRQALAAQASIEEARQ